MSQKKNVPAWSTGEVGSGERVVVKITPPAIERVRLLVRGTAPYVQHAFAQKSIAKMHRNQAAGSTAGKGRAREARDFKADFEGAHHRMPDGSFGIPATAFRCALIDACRMAGFKMTFAKMSIFVAADGFDPVTRTPLVRFTKGKPEMFEAPARNSNGGMDLRVRPLWREGWEARPEFAYDSAQFTAADFLNLLHRAGMQVGIGEGRPFSRESAGQGWGTFEIVE